MEARDLLVEWLELLLLRDLCPEELVIEDLELELNGIAASLQSHCSAHEGRGGWGRRSRRRNIVANLLLVLELVLEGLELARELSDADFVW